MFAQGWWHFQLSGDSHAIGSSTPCLHRSARHFSTYKSRRAGTASGSASRFQRLLSSVYRCSSMWLLTLLRTGTPIAKDTFRGALGRRHDRQLPCNGRFIEDVTIETRLCEAKPGSSQSSSRSRAIERPTVAFGPMKHVLQNTLRLCFSLRVRACLLLYLSAPTLGT